MNKPTFIIGFPIISKLIRGYTVELNNVCFIPDDQLFNESKNMYGCVNLKDKLPKLCQRCPYPDKCTIDERPGSKHCFAVLQKRNPLEDFEDIENTVKSEIKPTKTVFEDGSAIDDNGDPIYVN